MVTNCFGNKNFMQPMRRLRGLVLSFGFGGAGGGGSFVFGWFPMCSHQVLKVFP